MSNKVDYEEILEELEEYGHLDGTENGEYWLALANFYNSALNSASEDFMKILEKEILEQYNWIKENTKIVETEQVNVTKSRYIEYL
jgi:hypothetical protein